MHKSDHRHKDEEQRREQRRQQALYRRTNHYKKWDRVEQSQAYKFKSSVASTKPVFDCLGMIGFSATLFGLTIAAHLSQPMNELCERQLTASFLLLGTLGLVTGSLAFQPVGHWVMMQFAGSQKSSLSSFPSRVAGLPRTGIAFAGVVMLVAYAGVFAMAYSFADQMVSRVPSIVCIGPLP
jgi:hypothetical protein